MKNRCGPPQCNGATRPLSRDCCCPSLLQLWQLPPSLLGVATAPFSTVTMRLLAGCSFTISSPHWRIVITKQHPGLFKRWFWKIPPTYYLTLLTISRDVTGCAFFWSQTSLPRSPPESPHCSVLYHLKVWVTWTRTTAILTQPFLCYKSAHPMALLPVVFKTENGSIRHQPWNQEYDPYEQVEQNSWLWQFYYGEQLWFCLDLLTSLSCSLHLPGHLSLLSSPRLKTLSCGIPNTEHSQSRGLRNGVKVSLSKFICSRKRSYFQQCSPVLYRWLKWTSHGTISSTLPKATSCGVAFDKVSLHS